MTDPTGSAGRARLAEVPAMRGGRAEPEAAFSLKQGEDEGLAPDVASALTPAERVLTAVGDSLVGGHVAS